jgi:hypothetical protein
MWPKNCTSCKRCKMHAISVFKIVKIAHKAVIQGKKYLFESTHIECHRLRHNIITIWLWVISRNTWAMPIVFCHIKRHVFIFVEEQLLKLDQCFLPNCSSFRILHQLAWRHSLQCTVEYGFWFRFSVLRGHKIRAVQSEKFPSPHLLLQAVCLSLNKVLGLVT